MDEPEDSYEGQSALPIPKLIDLHDQFLRFLRTRVGDIASAEDILQSAYVKAMEHGEELREQESVVAWFYRILRNAVADHFRRAAARTKAFERLGAETAESYEHELQNTACACIKDVIRELKPEYRTAIEQVDLAGESVEAFAKAHNTSPNNASVRLHRARKAVASRLAAACGTCAEHKCIDCTCRKRPV